MNASIRLVLVYRAITTTRYLSAAEIREALARVGCQATTRTVQRDLNALRRHFNSEILVVGRAGGYRYRWTRALLDDKPSLQSLSRPAEPRDRAWIASGENSVSSFLRARVEA
jgi:predicted DNA-binding transcriptional regulator YafY